jgi:hypothetical protein
MAASFLFPLVASISHSTKTCFSSTSYSRSRVQLLPQERLVKRRLNVAKPLVAHANSPMPPLLYLHGRGQDRAVRARKGDPCILCFIDTEAFAGHGRVHIGAVLLAREMYGCQTY